MRRAPRALFTLLVAIAGLAAVPVSASAVPVFLETEANYLEAAAPIEGLSENLVFETASFDTECVESRLSGELEANEAEPVVVRLGEAQLTGPSGSRCSTSLGAFVTVAVETNAAEGWALEAEHNETTGVGRIAGESGPLLVRLNVYMGETKIGTCAYTAPDLDFTYGFSSETKEPTVLSIPATAMEPAPGCPAGTVSGEFVLSNETLPIAIEAAGPGFSVGEINFVGKPKGDKRTVSIVNKGPAVAWLEDAWIEEGGVKPGVNFKLVPAGGVFGCEMPGGKKPFEKLNREGECEIKVEFATGAAGKAGKFVVEIDGFWRNWTISLPIKS